MNSLAFSAAPIAGFMAISGGQAERSRTRSMAEARSAAQDWLVFAAALSRDPNARDVRGPDRSTSGGPKGIKLPECWHSRDGRESGPTAKFGLVNILKQAPARWMRPGSENRGSTLILLRERLKPAETLPGMALWELGVSLAARVARSAKRNSTYWESDFLSGLCHRVVDSDLEHGTAPS